MNNLPVTMMMILIEFYFHIWFSMQWETYLNLLLLNIKNIFIVYASSYLLNPWHIFIIFINPKSLVTYHTNKQIGNLNVYNWSNYKLFNKKFWNLLSSFITFPWISSQTSFTIKQDSSFQKSNMFLVHKYRQFCINQKILYCKRYHNQND